jgi:soluble lytic murein transglycosylase-like protein
VIRLATVKPGPIFLLAIGVAVVGALPAAAGTFWSRQRADGVVEFTNKAPAGKQWKVLFKTGPGQAGALRGSTDIVPPRDTAPARFSRYDRDIRDSQAFYGIPEAFMRAVIKTESDYDPNVVSSVGAQGLMQLLPGTARQMGVINSFDPRQNIMGGARYLQVLARRFCHTPAATDDAQRPGERLTVCSPDEKIKVVAGYHAGPGAVEKYGGVPPYETTRMYVGMVMRRYEQYRTVAGAGSQ